MEHDSAKFCEEESKNPIQVADRLFGILELLADQGSLPLMDIARAEGLNKATAHRVLHSLMYMGYARQNADGTYALTLKLAALADQVIGREDMTAAIHPYLQKLMEETGETVHLVRRDGTDAVYIDKVEAETGRVRMDSQIGGRIPLYCSGVGKAICAEMKAAEVAALWQESDIRRITPYTITDYDDFLYALEEVRKKGYALDNEENETGVRCIASSVSIGRGGQYAFSISAPVSRMDNDRIRALAECVMRTREAIRQDL